MENNNSKWSWTEPSEEEFNTRMKNETFYRIFSKDSTGKYENVYKFWAKGADEAFARLNEYKKDHVDGKEYFYSSSGYFVSPDGKRFDTIGSMINLDRLQNRNVFVKIWDFLAYRIPGLFRHIRLKIADVWHYATTGHPGNKWYSIDYHILDELVYNVTELRVKTNSIPTQVVEEVKNELKTSRNNLTDEESFKLATERWKNMLHSFVTTILTYNYYRDFGIIDEKDYRMRFIKAMYEDTIPHVPGTDNEIDYVKLHELIEREWEKIWDWMKKYGQNLWD